jgi:hypothetical protein
VSFLALRIFQGILFLSPSAEDMIKVLFGTNVWIYWIAEGSHLTSEGFACRAYTSIFNTKEDSLSQSELAVNAGSFFNQLTKMRRKS